MREHQQQHFWVEIGQGAPPYFMHATRGDVPTIFRLESVFGFDFWPVDYI